MALLVLPLLASCVREAEREGGECPPGPSGLRIVDGKNLVEKDELVFETGSAEPFTGRAVGYFENGRKSYEEAYRAGRRDGPYVAWHENGRRQVEAEYRDGIKVGRYACWYENGQPRLETTYRDRVDDGHYVSWYENGQKNREGEFRHGREEGLWIFWHRNGRKKWEIVYEREVPMSRKTWDENGVLTENWIR